MAYHNARVNLVMQPCREHYYMGGGDCTANFYLTLASVFFFALQRNPTWMRNCKIAGNWLTCLLDYIVRRQMRKSNLEKGNYYKLSSLIFFSCGLEIISDNIPYTVLKRHQSKKLARSRARKERNTVFNWWEASKTSKRRQVKQWRLTMD